MTTFEELKSDLNEKNRELKSVYGKQFPSLPLVLKRRNRTELNSGHTQSVLMGYNARVFNFLEAWKSNGLTLTPQE
jgi:hypothetical protein